MSIKSIINGLRKIFCFESESKPKSVAPSVQETFKWDIFSPCDGKIMKKEEINDPAFSGGAMGEGLGILPTDGNFGIFAEGKVSVVYHTKHAYFIEHKDPKNPISIMIHIGINTVSIDVSKQLFVTDLKVGDVVKVGDDLCKADLQGILAEEKLLDTALLVQNDNMEGKKVIFHKESGDVVKKGDLLMSVVSI